MIRTLTAAEAATLAGATVAAVRRMCRTGAVAAAKAHGRWAVDTASLLHRLNRPARRPADRLRKGEAVPQRTGRAARVCVGHHMSVARRAAFLGALVARWNGAQVTAEAYLANVLGADAEFVRRFASPFGRAVAKAYRARFSADPAKGGTAWRSRMLVDCFAYAADELLVLEEAARSYKRTALLLAA